MMLVKSKAYRWCAQALLCLFLLFHGPLFSQSAVRFPELTQPVSFKVTASNLSKVLESLQHQTDFSFTFEKELFSNIPVQNINWDHLPLGKALEFLQHRYQLQFAVAGKNIAVKMAPEKRKQLPVPEIIKGKVSDKYDKPLEGVTVQVKGTAAVMMTGNDGSFSIRVADAQKDILVFTFVGHTSREIKIAGQSFINIQLLPDEAQLAGVIVNARRRINNENALLNERRTAAAVSDGISARTMEKTASITTTQALQRVSGVSITDDKFVAIRGLGDRSVIAQLNGARLSSSDPDRTSVPLDLVPAALLDNVTVYKTLTPDKPADASAGIIEMKTKSVPDQLVLSFTAQTGANSTIGMGGNFNAFRNHNLGFLGQHVNKNNISAEFLALKDQYPEGRSQMQQLFINSRYSPELTTEAFRINRIMLGFDPVITTSYQKAKPNQVYSFTFGNNFKLLGRNLGVIVSGNYYRRTEDRHDGQLNQYSIYQGIVTGTPIYNKLRIPGFITPSSPNLGKYLSYRENTGIEKLNYGMLAGLTYQFNNRHEISAQYLFSRGAQAEGTKLAGYYANTGLTSTVYNEIHGLKQTFRVFNTADIQGEHKFWKQDNATRLSWSASRSASSQNEPDYRFVDMVVKRDLRFVDQNGVGVGSNTYGLVIGTVHGIGPLGVITADPNGRRYRMLKEDNNNLKADLAQPFKLLGQKQELKFGVNYLKRERRFTENVLGLPNNYEILDKNRGDLNALVSYNNIGLLDPSAYNDEGQLRVGKYLYQIKKSPNNYTGVNETKAFYTMADIHLNDQWRLIGGARWESTDIRSVVDTAGVLPDTAFVNKPGLEYEKILPNTSYSTGFKPYFSGNLIYTFKKNMNFRLAFSQSLARPELRELTNIYQFDPFQFAVVAGNPSLRNQLTKSLDFRWEWFTSPGEVISVSAFGKIINDQLTKVFILNGLGNESYDPEYPIVKYVNDTEDGRLYGIELELRKHLGTLWKPLKGIYVGTNSMFSHSEIKMNPERLRAARIINRTASETSPIFEQAPYVINAYIDYENPKTKTNINVSFNMTGERLVQVQLDGTPDLYDRPAPMLDLTFSQQFLKRFVVKGFMKNILNPPFRVVYAQPRSNGTYFGKTYIQREYYRGMEYAIGITYNMF